MEDRIMEDRDARFYMDYFTGELTKINKEETVAYVVSAGSKKTVSGNKEEVFSVHCVKQADLKNYFRCSKTRETRCWEVPIELLLSASSFFFNTLEQEGWQLDSIRSDGPSLQDSKILKSNAFTKSDIESNLHILLNLQAIKNVSDLGKSRHQTHVPVAPVVVRPITNILPPVSAVPCRVNIPAQVQQEQEDDCCDPESCVARGFMITGGIMFVISLSIMLLVTYSDKLPAVNRERIWVLDIPFFLGIIMSVVGLFSEIQTYRNRQNRIVSVSQRSRRLEYGAINNPANNNANNHVVNFSQQRGQQGEIVNNSSPIITINAPLFPPRSVVPESVSDNRNHLFHFLNNTASTSTHLPNNATPDATTYGLENRM